MRRAGRNVPVVLMTAYAAEEQLEAAILEGAFAVLKKPFDIAQAVGVLARAFERPLVLVVDDDPAVAASIVATLCASGVHAEAVFSGVEALALLDARRVDVCVTDLVMPGMDGAALATSLHAKNPAPAVVLISGHDTREAMKRIPAATVEGCLKKPFLSNELLRTVARARSRPLGA
jgi:CheY-like chemotaxis protein